MSFETDMITKYGPTLAGRLYWHETPDNWQPADRNAPFCIMQQVGGKRQTYVDDKEQPEYLNARIQFFMWGSNYMSVAEKMRELQAVIMASNEPEFYAEIIGEPVSDSNDVLKLRGSRQDVGFWWKNPLFVGP